MHKWKIAAALLACLFLPALARADALTPAKAADIKKLFAVSKTDVALRQVIDACVAEGPLIAAQQGVKFTPETRQVIDAVLRDLYTEKILGPGGALDQMVPIVADAFTDDEIRRYIEFYETPLGKKIADTTPEMTKRQGEVMTGVTLNIMVEFPQRLIKAMREKGLIQPQRRTPQSPSPAAPK